MDKITEVLIESLDSTLEHKGVSIELPQNINSNHINLYEEKEKDNIRIHNDGESMDKILFLETILDMLKNKEIDLTINKVATQKHIDYLKKLSECILP